MDFDIKTHTIFLTLTGSRVYGTANEASDHDYRGVLVPPKRYFLGCSSRFEQHESHDPDDTVVYGVNKFLKLAKENSPNIMELLYIKPDHWVQSEPEWYMIHDARDLFLSKKCYHTFRGYAHSQLRRTKSHRAWLLQGEVQEPKREDFGLATVDAITKELMGATNMLIALWLRRTDIEEDLAEIARHDKSLATAFRQRMWEFMELHVGASQAEIEELAWTAAARQLGLQESILDRLQKEKRYRQAKRNYDSWLHWKAERNQKRKEVEAKCGYDSKHLAHCLRLMRTCEEILAEGTILVERPDAHYLRAILDGQYKFEELEQEYYELDKRLDELYQKSTLQNIPRQVEIEALGIEVVERFLKRVG